MSKTFSRKVHQGEIKKRENEIERKKKDEDEKEILESLSWAEGSKILKKEVRKQKEKEKEDHKKLLNELYEKEMNES